MMMILYHKIISASVNVETIPDSSPLVTKIMYFPIPLRQQGKENKHYIKLKDPKGSDNALELY